MMAVHGIKHLVLLGLGRAHIQVLRGLADIRPADLHLTVIAPRPQALMSPMVPGFVAGHYTLAQCQMPLDGLLERSGAHFVAGSVAAIDAHAQRVTLASGDTVAWDWLGINTGPVMDREKIESAMPGARRHALFARPLDGFVHLWPQVLAMATDRAIHLALIGAGATGVELALAAAQALLGPGVAPGSHVSLLSGGAAPAATLPGPMQVRALRALRRLGVTVIPETCTGLEAGAIHLSNGARLVCDAPLLAIGPQAPAWLADSGLALDDDGFIAVNAFQQSTSHPRVFAAGDVASRADAPHTRDALHAHRAGAPLLANLRAAMAGQTLMPHQPPRRVLQFLACGERRAIGGWGGLGFEGGWVWRWKDQIDRAFVARHAA
jgi:NADH dehydrogenase FAD-containing subunit